MAGLEESPPLSPEQWNLAAVLLVCGLMSWMLRLLQLLCIYLEVHFAVQRRAVLHFKDLGASLLILRYASMWHFQQLVRTQLRASSSLMRRLRVPFDIVSASVRVFGVVEGGQRARTELAVQIKCDTECFVQVFFGVKVDAVEAACRVTTNLSEYRTWHEQRRRRDSALGRLGLEKGIRAVRTLPGKLSGIGRQDEPYRLKDDDKDSETREPMVAAQGQLCMSRLFAGDDAFQGCSDMKRNEAGNYIAALPIGAARAEAVTPSCIANLQHENDLKASLAPAFVNVEAPRYAAVIAVGFAEPSEDASKQDCERGDEVLVQCAVIEFLPTPGSGCCPMITKKINFTSSNAYTQQEIFEGGECVICLEEALAVILLPCRHFCVCRVCLDEIDRCPICRARFTTYACYTATGAPFAAGVPTIRAGALELI